MHSAHHCALSAAAVVAARGQGQRNLEFPEAVISVNWKKNAAFYFLLLYRSKTGISCPPLFLKEWFIDSVENLHGGKSETR